MSNTTKKQPMSVVKKMMIALVGGLLVGIAFLLLREQLISSGNEGAWTILNKILFQDITAEDGVSAIGLFYIIGQLFMTACDCTTCISIPQPCDVQYFKFHKAWKNCRTYTDRILSVLCMWCILSRYRCICGKISRIFQRNTSK